MLTALSLLSLNILIFLVNIWNILADMPESIFATMVVALTNLSPTINLLKTLFSLTKKRRQGLFFAKFYRNSDVSLALEILQEYGYGVHTKLQLSSIWLFTTNILRLHRYRGASKMFTVSWTSIVPGFLLLKVGSIVAHFLAAQS